MSSFSSSAYPNVSTGGSYLTGQKTLSLVVNLDSIKVNLMATTKTVTSAIATNVSNYTQQLVDDGYRLDIVNNHVAEIAKSTPVCFGLGWDGSITLGSSSVGERSKPPTRSSLSGSYAVMPADKLYSVLYDILSTPAFVMAAVPKVPSTTVTAVYPFSDTQAIADRIVSHFGWKYVASGTFNPFTFQLVLGGTIYWIESNYYGLEKIETTGYVIGHLFTGTPEYRTLFLDGLTIVQSIGYVKNGTAFSTSIYNCNITNPLPMTIGGSNWTTITASESLAHPVSLLVTAVDSPCSIVGAFNNNVDDAMLEKYGPIMKFLGLSGITLPTTDAGYCAQVRSVFSALPNPMDKSSMRTMPLHNMVWIARGPHLSDFGVSLRDASDVSFIISDDGLTLDWSVTPIYMYVDVNKTYLLRSLESVLTSERSELDKARASAQLAAVETGNSNLKGVIYGSRQSLDGAVIVSSLRAYVDYSQAKAQSGETNDFLDLELAPDTTFKTIRNRLTGLVSYRTVAYTDQASPTTLIRPAVVMFYDSIGATSLYVSVGTYTEGQTALGDGEDYVPYLIDGGGVTSFITTDEVLSLMAMDTPPSIVTGFGFTADDAFTLWFGETVTTTVAALEQAAGQTTGGATGQVDERFDFIPDHYLSNGYPDIRLLTGDNLLRGIIALKGLHNDRGAVNICEVVVTTGPPIRL